jgi:hypothetical protein
MLKLSLMLRKLICEAGQDLVQYALVVALTAFAATSGMKIFPQPERTSKLSPRDLGEECPARRGRFCVGAGRRYFQFDLGS